MLDLPRYLSGVAEVALLAGFAAMGASALRSRLLPGFSGAPAHLATAVLALALLIWVAELLGSFGLYEPALYLLGVAVFGLGLWLGVGGGRGCPSRLLGFSPRSLAAVRDRGWGEKQDAAAREGHTCPPTRSRSPGTAGEGASLATLVALVIAAVAVVKFGADVRPRLSTGMTGFDSTWYHGPFAAGFFQSGSTWDLHFIAPQFLAWFYPANAEIFHAAGMLAFGRDLLSPLLNLAWFVGCLLACWCIGRPYRVAPWSLALGAVALSLPVLADQAGEARNDIVGIFFLLAAVAVALNARPVGSDGQGWPGSKADDGSRTRDLESVATDPQAISGRGGHWETGPLIVIGLATGLAAGAKLNFLLPAVVLVLGLPFMAPAGRRWRALATAGLAALAGGGYWYLRNLIHSGNPLPWFDHLGPISLPAPDQALGGREGHSVLGYLTDGSVWSDWFLPGFHGGLTTLWPLLGALALAGLLLSLFQPGRSFGGNDVAGEPRDRGPDGSWLRRWVGSAEPTLWIAGLAGLAAIAAWLIAPTSASGPEGMPRGFESGLRYLAPALVLGLALLPATPPLRRLLRRWQGGTAAGEGGGDAGAGKGSMARESRAALGRERGRRFATGPTRRAWIGTAGAVALIAIAAGYPVQRHYLENRYANPTFAAPGLNAAFMWADGIAGARIATTSTRQYPLYGAGLTNHVQYVGEKKPHGGFVAPATCRGWRQLLNAGNYEYVIATRDRIEADKPPFPPTARWTEGPRATAILRKPPTVILKLTGPLDPSACP